MKGATAHAVQLNIFYKASLADLYCTFMLHDGTTARALNEAFCGCSGELYGRDKDREMVSGNQSTSEVRTKGRCDHRWKQGAGVRTTSCICQGTCNAGNVGSKRQRPQWLYFTACSFAMGREFLKAGDALVLCGRNEQRVGAAVDALRAEWPGSEVLPHRAPF